MYGNGEEYSIGDTHPSHEHDIDKSDFVTFMGASGHYHPLHWDGSWTKEAGFPTVFAPSPLISTFVSSYIVEWFEIENIISFRTRFKSKLWPSDTITISGEISDKCLSDESITLEVDLIAENQEENTIITGDATIELPR
jgi:acyl dehydratase